MAEPDENGHNNHQVPPPVAEQATVTTPENVQEKNTLGVGGQVNVVLEDKGLERATAQPCGCSRVVVSEGSEAVSQRNEAQDRQERHEAVKPVVILLGLKMVCEIAIASDGEECGHDGRLVVGEPGLVSRNSLLDETCKHADKHNDAVETCAEFPLVEIPFDAEDSLKDGKDPAGDGGPPRDAQVEDEGDCDLAQNRRGVIVVLGANGHGQIDDYEPVADEGGKVVEHVVSVHDIREGAAEDIHAQHDSGNTAEGEVVLGQEVNGMTISSLEEVRRNKQPNEHVDSEMGRGTGPVVDENHGLHPALPLLGLVPRKDAGVLLDRGGGDGGSRGARLSGLRLADGDEGENGANGQEDEELIHDKLLVTLGEELGAIGKVAEQQGHGEDADLEGEDRAAGRFRAVEDVDDVEDGTEDDVENGHAQDDDLDPGRRAIVGAAGPVVGIALELVELGIAAHVEEDLGLDLGDGVNDVETRLKSVDHSLGLIVRQFGESVDQGEVALSGNVDEEFVNGLNLALVDAIGAGTVRRELVVERNSHGSNEEFIADAVDGVHGRGAKGGQVLEAQDVGDVVEGGLKLREGIGFFVGEHIPAASAEHDEGSALLLLNGDGVVLLLGKELELSGEVGVALSGLEVGVPDLSHADAAERHIV